MGEEDSPSGNKRKRSAGKAKPSFADEQAELIDGGAGGEAYKAYLRGEDPTGMLAAYSNNKRKRVRVKHY